MIEEPEPAPRPPSKLKEARAWIALLLLAALVVCSGCSVFIATGLVARGELTAAVLGTDLRLWAITERSGTGLGLQRSYRIQRQGSTCTHFDVTFLLWRPTLSLDNRAYDDCG